MTAGNATFTRFYSKLQKKKKGQDFRTSFVRLSSYFSSIAFSFFTSIPGDQWYFDCPLLLFSRRFLLLYLQCIIVSPRTLIKAASTALVKMSFSESRKKPFKAIETIENPKLTYKTNLNTVDIFTIP